MPHAEFWQRFGSLSLQAAALVPVIALLQCLLGGWLAPRWRCWLWGLVALRLCLPVSLGTGWSLFNLLPRWHAAPSVSSPSLAFPELKEGPATAWPGLPQAAPALSQPMPQPTTLESTESPEYAGQTPPRSAPVAALAPRWPRWLLAAWLAGFLSLAARYFWAGRRVARWVRSGHPCQDPMVLAAVAEAAAAFGVRSRVAVVELADLGSPALHGFLRPTLLLPKGLADRLDAAQLRHVLLHEFAHVKRRDIAANWFLAVLQAIHWFNPLVWFAFARLRAERELACDELALQSGGDTEPEAYGRTILALLSGPARPAFAPGVVGILEDRRDLRRRLLNIAGFRPGRPTGVLAALVVALAGAVTLTDAQTPEAKPTAATAPTNLPPVVPLTYTNLLRAPETKEFAEPSTWGLVPRGSNVLGSVRFQIDGLIKLQGLAGKRAGRDYREHVTLSCPTNTYGAIHILGATAWKAEPNHRVADIVWRYADGTFKRSSIAYAAHLRDAVRTPFEEPARVTAPFCKVVWTAMPTNTAKAGRAMRLYRATLANPDPKKAVAFVQFQSTMDEPSLAFVAVSLDPLALGLRPDPTPDLEGSDPEFSSHLALVALDAATSNRIPGFTAKAAVKAVIAGAKVSFDRTFTANGAGVADILLPESGVTDLEIVATQKDYAPQKLVLRPTAAEPLPQTTTVKLSGGFEIGGIVLDESGDSIPGAKVEVYRFWTGDDRMDAPGEQPGFTRVNASTGADGRWQAAGVPADLLHRIGISAEHADYAPAQLHGLDRNPAEVKALREKRHELRLKAGVVVAGIVVDSAGNPIPGAAVLVGQRYLGTTKSTKTGDDGRFKAGGLAEGPSIVSATAKGYAIAAAAVNFAPGMPEVRLVLEPGLTIKGQVQDAEGNPLAGVFVNVETDGGKAHSRISNLDFNTRTDAEGHFRWDEAPDMELGFAFNKEGFATKTGVRLKPSEEEHVVTLGKPRTAEGVVVDHDTGDPVKEFTLEPRGVWWQQDDRRTFKTADGTFSMPLTKDHYDRFEVSAPGFEAREERIPAAVDGVVSMTIRLKAAETLEGVVVDSSGSPVAGATVATLSPEAGWVMLRSGQLAYDGGLSGPSRVTRTGPDGRFRIEAVARAQGIAAAHPRGFAVMPQVQFDATKRIVLVEFGRVEGTYQGRRGAEGPTKLAIQLGAELSAMGIGLDFGAYQAPVGAGGTFEMEGLPAGSHQLMRVVPLDGNTSWQLAPIQPIEIRPGETTRVDVKNVGCRLVGRLQPIPGLSLEGAKVFGSIHTPIPGFRPGMTPEAIKAMAATPEFQALQRSLRHYPVSFKPDGTFVAEDVVAGTYQIEASAFAGGVRPGMTPSAMGLLQFVVPEGSTPEQDLDIGEVPMAIAPESGK